VPYLLFHRFATDGKVGLSSLRVARVFHEGEGCIVSRKGIWIKYLLGPACGFH